MDKQFDISQREEFKKILIKLANSSTFLKDPNERKEFYRKFEGIYYINKNERFRHFYSDIFGLLVEINSDNSLDSGDIEILGGNLTFLVKNYQPMNYDENNELIDIRDSLWKLYDHVSLDIARIRYSNSEDDRLSHELEFNRVANKLSESEEKISKLSNETEQLKKSLSKAQLDYIAILGIFASIVLSFVGGITFSTSVLENIKNVSVYRLLIVALIIGAIFVTIIFLMFYYVGVLSNRLELSAKHHIPLIAAYVFIIVMIGAVVVSWWRGDVEARNNRINNVSQTESEITTETTLVSDTSDMIVQTTPE